MIKDSVSKDKSELMVFKDDLGQNVYRKKSYYIVKIEQDVMADNIDEANDKFIEKGGINHSNITKDITDENDGVTTHYVEADYGTCITEYHGKVTYTDDEYAEENGDVEINTDVEEDSPFKDYKENVLKEESDIDIALNLEAESQVGK
jgi:hypothetical protein|tara:strand:- start:38 stop:481 length:444 start_codon:yes stop_codon:yes gene_type:complete